jgi:class 3 adenylate cyclase/Tfp pilus assembly protein PilF
MLNEPKSDERIHALLTQYGWEMGLRKLREEAAAASDPALRNNLLFFAGWMAAERGAHAEAQALLQEAGESPATQKWAQFVQAFLALRQQQFEEAERLLDGVKPDVESTLLEGAVAHLRGAIYFHKSDLDRALGALREALRLFGSDHCGTGRVLDTFGMVYAAQDNFHAAEEFFRQAIARKEYWNDQAGLAVSHGNVGRLNLDWGYLEQAESRFLEDLAIARKTHDERGESLMHNGLGRIALERGNRAAAVCRPSEARQHWVDAAGWLDSSIKSAAGRWTISEGYARKDRALLHLAQAELQEADAEVHRAEEIFRAAGFSEGLAHVNRTAGMIRRAQGRFDDAKQLLRAALDHFTVNREHAEQARTQWEIARLAQAAGEPRPLTTIEFTSALAMAESCRRAHLVRGIEEELKAVNAEAFLTRVFRRARGRGIPDETDSLISGINEPLTVIFLDIKGSTSYALETPPEVVMMSFNQMMANAVGVLRQHDARINEFRGDGFMAMFRGQYHAMRAVSAALDLCRLNGEYNEPRIILGLKPFAIRIGISTGDAVLGNVGTYDLMDYTALGTTTNLGARLESVADPGIPCISQRTYNEVRGRFRYRDGSPRVIVAKGLEELGEQQVWDVVGMASQ